MAQPSSKDWSKLRTHSPGFKPRVAEKAISGRKTIQKIATSHTFGLRHAGHVAMRPDPEESMDGSGSSTVPANC